MLKSGLMLIDAPDIRFKVSNFTQQHVAHGEALAERPRSAVDKRGARRWIRLLRPNTDSGQLNHPDRLYLNLRGLGSSYLTASSTRVTGWRSADGSRSLIKRGIWGSGLDTLLPRLRDVLHDHGTDGFPLTTMEAMAAGGKSLRFDDAEIAELCDLRFGSPRVFPVLATLYPGLDLSMQFHEDHIFPRSRFTRSKLFKVGITAESIDEYLDKVDALPNLQLLAGLPNIEKQAKLPAEWLDGPHFPTIEERATYISTNDLDNLPNDLSGFLEFCHQRRASRTRCRCPRTGRRQDAASISRDLLGGGALRLRRPGGTGRARSRARSAARRRRSLQRGEVRRRRRWYWGTVKDVPVDGPARAVA